MPVSEDEERIVYPDQTIVEDVRVDPGSSGAAVEGCSLGGSGFLGLCRQEVTSWSHGTNTTGLMRAHLGPWHRPLARLSRQEWCQPGSAAADTGSNTKTSRMPVRRR